LSLAISTAVSLGKGLPGEDNGNPMAVLLASAEDGLGDTIRPRLDTMKADVGRIFAIDGVFTLDDSGLGMLETAIAKYKPALLVIDPLVAYLGADVDIHRSNEVRAVMAKLANLAARYNVAILAIRHLTKGGMSKPIYRGLGSIDFTAACRSVLLAGSDPANPQSRGLVHIKSNLAPTGKAIGFELRGGGFYWTNDCDLTAAKILAAEESEGKSAIDEAIDFLKDELAEGPVEASQVWRDARNMGLSSATLNRAKTSLGVITKRKGKKGKKGGGKFIWELPVDTYLEGQKDLGYQGYQVEKFDNVNKNRYENYPDETRLDNLNPEKGGLVGQADLGAHGDNLNADMGRKRGQSGDRREAISKNRTTLMSLQKSTKTGLEEPEKRPHTALDSIALIPEEEKQKLLTRWRAFGAPKIHLKPGINLFDLEKELNSGLTTKDTLGAIYRFLEEEEQGWQKFKKQPD
jgi:hypothetical protein